MRIGLGAGPRWARACVVVGAVLILTSALALAGGRMLVGRYAGSVHSARLLGEAGAAAVAAPQHANAVAHAALAGPINVLLAGIDERLDDPSAGARSDSILMLHISAAHDQVYLMSIPRDTRVEIPAYPATGYSGGVDKINAAFQNGFANGGGRAGGFELLALTVRQLTGVTFHGGAIINFEGLKAAVDAIGGVDLCVDEETTSIHIGWDTTTGRRGAPYRLSAPGYSNPQPIRGMRAQVYHVGCQHFVGWQALDYVRQRELLPDGDYGRQRHQQQLIKALVTKVAGAGMLTDPLAADRTLRALGNTVTFDGNGVSMIDWVFALKDVDPGSITMIKTNGGQFTSQVIGGQDFEVLDDTTMQAFAAMREDTLGAFVINHPEWITSSGPS